MESLASVPRDETQRLPFYARVAATLAAVFPRRWARPSPPRLCTSLRRFAEHPPGTASRSRASPSRDERAVPRRTRQVSSRPRVVRVRRAQGAHRDVSRLRRGRRVRVLESSAGISPNTRTRRLARAPSWTCSFASNPSKTSTRARSNSWTRRTARVARRRPRPRGARRLTLPSVSTSGICRYEILSDDALPRGRRQRRKLDWAEHERYVVKCVVKVHRGRFDNVATVARLVGAMSKWRDSFAPTRRRRRVGGYSRPDWSRIARGKSSEAVSATMRLLGELHRAKIVTTSVVFAQLYLLISFGHDEREATVEGRRRATFAMVDVSERDRSPVGVGSRATGVRAPGDVRSALRPRASSKISRSVPRFFPTDRLSKDTALDVSQGVADLLAELRPKLAPHGMRHGGGGRARASQADEARAARGGRGRGRASHGRDCGGRGRGGRGGRFGSTRRRLRADDEAYEDDDDETGSGLGRVVEI